MLPKFRRVMATCFCFWKFPCWKRYLTNDTDSNVSRRTHVAELTELPAGKDKAAVGVGFHPSQIPTMQNAIITIGATLLVRPGAQIQANNPSTEGAIPPSATEAGAINVNDTAQGEHDAASPYAQINAPSPDELQGGGTIYVNAAQQGGGYYSPSSTEAGAIIVNGAQGTAGCAQGSSSSGSTSQSKQPSNEYHPTVENHVVHHQQNTTNQFIPVPPTSSSTESVHYIIPNSKSFHMYPTCTKMYPSPRSNRPLGPERLL